MRAEREEDLMIHEYPYTDFHEMNLDWIIREMKKLVDEWASFASNVTASAHEAAQPEVTVTGDLKTSIDFDFGLVKGDDGPEGPEGPQGKGLEILGVYATLSDLQTAHPTGTPGDVYLVGTGGSYNIYVWNEDTSDWADGGPITSPAPSSSNPLMDGSADAGTDPNYSRADHVHPSDTSKQDVLVSGTNIKTINSESLLGSTDIALQEPLVSGTNIKTINSESLLGSTDIALQVPLVSGTNIKTINSESLLGSGDISIAPQALTVDVLWTNADSTTSFAPQTITMDLSSYQLILIRYRVSTGGTANTMIVGRTGGFDDIAIGTFASETTLYKRLCNIKTTGIEFYQGYVGTTADNTKMVPRTIFGVK